MRRLAAEIGRISIIVVLAVLASLSRLALDARAEEGRAAGADPILMMIDAAAARSDGAHLPSVLETAIAVAPERREELIAYARKAASQGIASSAIAGAVETAPDGPNSKSGAPAPGDPERRHEGYPLFEGEVDLGGTFNTGNTSERAVALALQLGYDTGLWKHVAMAAFDFSRKDGVTSKQRLFLSYQANRDIGSRFYGFGRGEFVKDRFTGFDYRLYGGGGLGYRVLENDDTEWALEAGPGARYSRFAATGLDETDFSFRLASAFEWDLSATARLSQIVEYLINGTRTLDATTSVTVKLSERLSGRASFSFRNDSDPPLGIEATDTTTKGSLVYGF